MKPRWGACRHIVAALALLLGFVVASSAHADPRLTVVELYTSQGCPACPAADGLLGELATRPGILALSFHVDYWDYIGWADPFANEVYSHRQQRYLEQLKLPYVYTPQMVVDGQLHASGNRRNQVETNIERARGLGQGRVEVSVTRISDGQVRIQIPGSDAVYRGEADIMLVRFDEKHITQVTRGENAGKTLTNHNIVRLLRPVADWNGEAVDMVMRLQDIGGADPAYCAIFVQERDQGRILGASVVDMRPRP
ncbi:MAG: DUF1223 domain-containing protein [Proteobacteria bacterium]|nr:DUF1223 domain-containing protein [Pseudomonadota bacterium]